MLLSFGSALYILEGVNIGVDVHPGTCVLFGVCTDTKSESELSTSFIASIIVSSSDCSEDEVDEDPELLLVDESSDDGVDVDESELVNVCCTVPL